MPVGAARTATVGWLLVSDIDDTLVGDDEALATFVRAADATPELTVALNSSRPIGSVRQTLEQLSVPLRPRATITAMGTEIHVDGEELPEWTRRFAGWDRTPIDRAMAELGVEPHAPEMQTPRKASFTVPAAERERAAAAVRATELPVHMIASGESDFDVIPDGAGKGEATLFLADALGVGRDRVVVAGDSANDLAMFEVAEKGVVVGNARAELRERVDRRKVWFATEPRARGVLEGLEGFGVPIKGAR